MGTTPNKGYPYPENTDKVGLGDDSIKALALAIDEDAIEIVPVERGGTNANNRTTARVNLGITQGTGNPSGGVNGDIFFKIV